MDIFLIYIWTRIDAFKGMFLAIAIGVGVCCIASAIVWLVNNGIFDEQSEAGKKGDLYTLLPP